MPRAAAACLLLGLTACVSNPQRPAPRATVDSFLEFYFQEYGSGLPDGAERATLRPMLTEEFAEALDRAAAAQRCASERALGQEPPLVQGDIFSSLFEKATAVVRIAQGTAAPSRVTYRLDFEWREPDAQHAASTWSDEVVLELVDGRWLIDDFIHGGDWQFTTRGSVKQILLGVAALCPASQ
jgi:hypothetical protein